MSQNESNPNGQYKSEVEALCWAHDRIHIALKAPIGGTAAAADISAKSN
jgi:hypothetical protein